MRAIIRLTVIVLGVGLFISSSLRADEPFYDGLGTTNFKVTAANPDAAKYVEQGIKFLVRGEVESAVNVPRSSRNRMNRPRAL